MNKSFDKNSADTAPIRILHILPTLEYGGIAMMLRNFYRYVDKSKLQFDFLHYGQSVPYHEELRQMGARIIPIPSMSTTGLFGYAKELRRILKQYGPFGAVHIHMNYMAGFIALVARLSGIKKRICHIRGTYIRSNKIKFALPLFRLLIRLNVTKLLAVSRESGRFYYGRRPFTVIRNAVDLAEYQTEAPGKVVSVRQELGIGPDALAIGHVARFTEEKNHAFLVDVALRLQQSGVSFRLFFAGDGPLMAHTQKLFADAGLDGDVVFLGNRSDIPALMHAFDVTVLPSVSEGLPNVVMQSQAAGTPCVLSKNLTHDVDVGLGLLAYCTLGDADAWTHNILSSVKKGKQAFEKVKEAFVASGFEITTAVANLERIYVDD